MATGILSAERLREVLNYDPETGVFTWNISRRGTAKAGSKAGSLDAKGYILIRVDGARFKAHRLAWFYIHEEWPEMIDHWNGDKSDNRIKNLRPASASVNSQNRRKAAAHRRDAALGVAWCDARQKWMARIKVDRRTLFLGRFALEGDAIEAYITAKRKLHEGCTI